MDQSNQSQSDNEFVSRRKSIQGATASTAAFTLVPRSVPGGPGYVSPSDKLNIAGVGVGGMGKHNLKACESENIVALCDVDGQPGRALSLSKTVVGWRKHKDYPSSGCK
jgi:hypothetical protein